MKKNDSLIEKLPDSALKPRFIELTFEQMMKISAIIETSHAKGLTKEEGMITVMRGQELGISPIASLEVISIIRGKKGGSSFAYHYSLYLALIRKNLPEAEIIFIRRDHEGCVIKARRSKTEDFMEFSFLKADAERANLLGKDNWRHYPTDLYCSKAVLRMGRILTPDVLLGLKDTPETILDWKEPLIDKISKPKKGKEKDAIPITVEEFDEYDWNKMDKKKKDKEEKDKKKATDAFLKASEKGKKGRKLALSPKKSKEKTQDKTLKEIVDEEQELQDNIEAVNDIIDEANALFPGSPPTGMEATKIPLSDVIVKPFDPKKKLSFKKKGNQLEKKVLAQAPSPKKKPKKEVTFVDDKNWEVAITDLSSYKYVETFNLCHSKSKYKVRYDIITKGFIDLIEAYFILYTIEEGTPFQEKFREIIQTKTRVMPVFVIYQKAFKDTFPDEHYHDLMKGFYDTTEAKIKELILIGEKAAGKPGNEFWGAFIDAGFRGENNVWIHTFLKNNNLFTVDEEIIRRIESDAS